MKLSTLSDWLDWIASIHPIEMDLGLDRVSKVAKKLKVLEFKCPVITIGGTNGKGSTVAGLEAIYQAAGKKVGAFTSPVMFKHNEGVRIDGNNPDDQAFCDAFAKVEAARFDVTLTPFEYHTLAALILLQDADLDVVILEVGLGGRLDAVNVVDADVAVVTSVGMDHMDYLGDTRDAIGFEKAGIFRQGRPAVCGDLQPPASLIAYAQKIGAKLYCQGVDFRFTDPALTRNQFGELDITWSWFGNGKKIEKLPIGQLARQNMSTALMVVSLLQQAVPVSEQHINVGLDNVTLAGRQQVIKGDVTEVYDVAHNPDAVQWLVEKLDSMPCEGNTHAVFSMLKDKDIDGCVELIKHKVDYWHIAELNDKRAATVESLKNSLDSAKVQQVNTYADIKQAYLAAKDQAKKLDRIVVFGSFKTIAAIEKGKGNE